MGYNVNPMKGPSIFRLVISSFLATVLLAACHPSPRDLAVVSGKAVYGDLALEDARLEIDKWEQAGWQHFQDARSGYHGSFRVHLPPGTYRFTASKKIRMGQGGFTATGHEDLKIDKPGGRIDQVIIRMQKQW